MPVHAVVGRPLPRLDAMEQTSGRVRYADDMTLPDTLVGRLLRSTQVHAAVTGIDTSRATALPGVKAVITGADLPITYGILPISQDENALATDRVRYVGEPVAAVAAVDAETAEAALGLIDVSYERLDEVMTLDQALADDRPLIHGQGSGQNVHRSVALEFGDLEEGMAVADHLREDVFFFRGSTHAALETHSALASYNPGGKLTLTMARNKRAADEFERLFGPWARRAA